MIIHIHIVNSKIKQYYKIKYYFKYIFIILLFNHSYWCWIQIGFVIMISFSWW